MWDIARLYVSACSNSVQLVPLQPIMISILFHHYKELKECISEVEQMEARYKDQRCSNVKSYAILYRKTRQGGRIIKVVVVVVVVSLYFPR